MRSWIKRSTDKYFIKRFIKNFDVLICISLNKSLDRRAYIKKHFKERGIENYIFFDATSSTDPIVDEFYSKALVQEYPPCFRCGMYTCGDDNCNNVLIRPQVATFISYIRLWKYIVKNRFQCVLITEDDVKFTNYFPQVARQFISDKFIDKTNIKGANPVLLRLGWALSEDHQFNGNLILKKNSCQMSNPCHAINGAAAKILLKNFHIIATTVDIYQHQSIPPTILSSYTVYPPISYELSWSTGELDSLIHPKQKRISYLEKEQPQELELISITKKALQEHRAHILYRKLLIIGHPRCGSGYMSKLLNAFDLDIGHESMGKDGISSWMFAASDSSYPYFQDEYSRSNNDKFFQWIIQHVRDPRTAVPSIMRDNTFAPKSYEFRRKHIFQEFNIDLNQAPSNFQRAVLSYIYWNKLIEKNKPSLIVKIENAESKLFSFLQESAIIDLSIIPKDLPEKSVNQNKPYQGKIYSKPTIRNYHWQELSKSLACLINEQCEQYGYALIEY
ncbi:glycosyltransferase family 25 protein [Leptothoe kymatousa]|uniref:Glycosyltransferase family 25 protein n=1 Tax=Leptothoe kymatousa TAU-MAC 1615 TaxID=2364775 RepID=A0ABS5Y5V3_9CYAN|nr:glycosyltransferase family 25 protein [Leptothoe kymatousa]MBT9313006.1 glycosyltransferase family 25 protein [Leptothoe kymatousa TAU-MAC 1615]